MVFFALLDLVMNMSDEFIIGLFVGFFVTLLIYCSIVFIFPKPLLSEQECRAIMATWCTTCRIENWVGGSKVDDNLASCSNYYFKTKWTVGIDCTASNVKEVCSGVISID